VADRAVDVAATPRRDARHAVPRRRPREWYLERLRTVDSIDRFETAPGDDAFYLKAYERLGGPLETFFDAFVDTEFLSAAGSCTDRAAGCRSG